MTLLLTVARANSCIAVSDLRVTYQRGKRFIPVDETFNKQISFNVGGFSAVISYTGIAQWTYRGRVYKMFEVIAESLARTAKDGIKYSLKDILEMLTSDLEQVLNIPVIQDQFLELHITGYEKDYGIPFIGCISTSEREIIWRSNSSHQHSFQNGRFNISFKLIDDQPEYLIGGMYTAVSCEERRTIEKILFSNARSFDIINYCTRLVRRCSGRTDAIGSKSVSALLPSKGVLDTNLWNKGNDSQLYVYMPSIVFQNGTQWAPVELPVNIDQTSGGYLRDDNIFFKSVIYATANRRLRRIIFKIKKGPRMPSIWEIMGFILFGDYPDDAMPL